MEMSVTQWVSFLITPTYVAHIEAGLIVNLVHFCLDRRAHFRRSGLLEHWRRARAAATVGSVTIRTTDTVLTGRAAATVGSVTYGDGIDRGEVQTAAAVSCL